MRNIGVLLYVVKFLFLLPFFIIVISILKIFFDIYLFGDMVVVLTAVLILAGLFCVFLFRRYRKSKYGLCEGTKFWFWMRDVLDKNGCDTIDNFLKKTSKTPRECGLKYRHGVPRMNNSEVSLICCDITSENKVEFPKDLGQYGMIRNISPSIFVRASMSIPYFYKPAVIHCDAPVIDKSEGFKTKWVRTENYFVDGGVISNFPINVFHSEEKEVCHIPVVGLSLNSGIAPKKDVFSNIMSYSFSLISTMRYYHDKEFLYQNKFYQDYCVHSIDVSSFHWLDFAMSKKKKLRLFEQGVKAGTAFLENFDWQEYKVGRKSLYEKTH